MKRLVLRKRPWGYLRETYYIVICFSLLSYLNSYLRTKLSALRALQILISLNFINIFFTLIEFTFTTLKYCDNFYYLS